jgi:hypothetical protein
MSIVETYKKEFNVFYYDEDPVRAQRLKDYFCNRDYSFEIFTSKGLLFEAIETQLPHVFLLHYQPLNMRFQEIIKKARTLSDEMELVVLSSKEFWPGVQKLIQAQVVDDSWSWPVLDSRALQLRLDKLIEKNIYKLIAEQRSPATQVISQKIDELIQQSREMQSHGVVAQKDLYDLVGTEQATESSAVENLLENLKQSQPSADFVYLKTYPARDQLLIYKTSFSDPSYFRGQSLKFNGEQYQKEAPAVRTQLIEQIKQALRCDDFLLEEVRLSDQVFGFIMALNYPESENLKKVARQLGLFLRNSQLEKTQSGPEQDILLDQEVSHRQFPLVLSAEISRARRLKSSVSLIIGQVEYVYDQAHNFRAIFEHIRESLRPYDQICQLSNGQIAIILPHCSYEDGAIKAETLRRQIVARGIQKQTTPLRLCFGVSEFPRLSLDSDSLLEDSRKACAQVYSAGKNKVCLFTQPHDFEPEYNVVSSVQLSP